MESEGVIRQGEETVLKHPMPGVTIRYVTDNTTPDTLQGLVYEHPFKFEETTVIKAVACKDAWYCSDIFEATCFVEGIKPHQVELLIPADPQYPGEGAQSLVDGRKGVADVLKEPSWLGYRNQSFAAGFTFAGKVPTLKRIVLSYGKNIGGYSLPPEEVEVWAGENKNQLKLIKKLRPEQPKGYEGLKVEALSIPIEPSTEMFYKIVAKPVSKLPQWHNGKGEKGWVFIDEIFFY